MRIFRDKINWRVALAEMSLIIIGILLALAIDSYVEDRSEQAQAAVYLSDLVTELQSDKSHFNKQRQYLESMIESATRLLRVIEETDNSAEDPGALLLNAIGGESVTREPAIWVEIQMTGALRLIPDPETKSAIVSYYLKRASRLKTIDENFVPAARDLRALAWDVMPLESFDYYMQSRKSGSGISSGVPAATVITGLQSKGETIYLLKRIILTGTVARIYLQKASDQTTELIEMLGH